MAEEKKPVAAPKKTSSDGKKPHKNKPTSQKYKHYTIEGDTVKRSHFCPRCGPGVFLMKTQDRLYCGKCHYTEFTSKPKEESSEKKEEKK